MDLRTCNSFGQLCKGAQSFQRMKEKQALCSYTVNINNASESECSECLANTALAAPRVRPVLRPGEGASAIRGPLCQDWLPLEE